jgi:hypothetical protein
VPSQLMRPIVKQEPGADGAQELLPTSQAAAAAASAAGGVVRAIRVRMEL